MGLIDDVFELLETATRLEKEGGNRIEAATKVREIGKMNDESTHH